MFTQILVPWRVLLRLPILQHFVGAANWIHNLDLGPAEFSLQIEAHSLRRHATHFQSVVISSGQNYREPSDPLLASLEAIPKMVHHAVEGVVVA